MAKAVKKVVKRRRERKTIEKGAVHIRSSFNNTMVTVTTPTATPCPGPPPAASASAAAESPLRTPRRWSQRPLQRQLWKTMV